MCNFWYFQDWASWNIRKWIFQFGLGLSPVLQYRPKPTRTAGPSAIFPYTRAWASFRPCRHRFWPRQLQLRPVPSPLMTPTCRPCRSSTCAGSAVLILCLVFGEKQSLLKSPTPSPSRAPSLYRRRRSSAPHCRTPPTWTAPTRLQLPERLPPRAKPRSTPPPPRSVATSGLLLLLPPGTLPRAGHSGSPPTSPSPPRAGHWGCAALRPTSQAPRWLVPPTTTGLLPPERAIVEAKPWWVSHRLNSSVHPAGILPDPPPPPVSPPATGIDRSLHHPSAMGKLPCFFSRLPAHGDCRPTRMG
jgi:hypothetical protein